MSRSEAEKRGRHGEAIADWLLWIQGWQIVDERVKTARGGIDLIARRGKTVPFVEVNALTKMTNLATAIDACRLRPVVAAAEILLPKYGKGS